MSDFTLTLGMRIKSARRANQMTQQQLGELIGKSISTIGRYESDKSIPNLEIRILIAQALDISVSHFESEQNENDDDFLTDLASKAAVSYDTAFPDIVLFYNEDSVAGLKEYLIGPAVIIGSGLRRYEIDGSFRNVPESAVAIEYDPYNKCIDFGLVCATEKPNVYDGFRSETVFYVGDSEPNEVFEDLRELSVIKFLQKYQNTIQHQYIENELKATQWVALFKICREQDVSMQASLILQSCKLFNIDRSNKDLGEIICEMVEKLYYFDCAIAVEMLKNSWYDRTSWLNARLWKELSYRGQNVDISKKMNDIKRFEELLERASNLTENTCVLGTRDSYEYAQHFVSVT